MHISTVKMLSGRETNYSGKGRFSSADRSHLLGRYLPVNGPWPVDRMDTRAYVSQFSSDGSLFIAGFQGSHIRIYNVDDGWKVQKDILAKSLRWTITDTSLSPDRQFLVYASMSPIVHIVNVGSSAMESHANINDIHDGLDFSMYAHGAFSFGIFSLKFSTDGRELVAGTSDDSIYVYDLEANRLTSRFPAHTEQAKQQPAYYHQFHPSRPFSNGKRRSGKTINVFPSNSCLLILSTVLDEVAGKHHGGYERGYGIGYKGRTMIHQFSASYNVESSINNSQLQEELDVANQKIQELYAANKKIQELHEEIQKRAEEAKEKRHGKKKKEIIKCKKCKG